MSKLHQISKTKAFRRTYYAFNISVMIGVSGLVYVAWPYNKSEAAVFMEKHGRRQNCQDLGLCKLKEEAAKPVELYTEKQIGDKKIHEALLDLYGEKP